MKTLAKISFLLLFFVTTVNAQDTQSEIGVVAIHQLELLPDVDAQAFEAFVLETIIPAYNKIKGQHALLVKGDRGVRTDKYALVLTFDSLADRNRIYPPTGGIAEDFGDESMWEKLMSMSKGMGETHTDYVRVMN